MDPNILWWGGLGLTWVVALTGGAFALLAWRRTQEYPDTRDLDQAVDAARRAGREVRNYVEEFTTAAERLGRQNQRLAAERARLQRVQGRRVADANADSGEDVDGGGPDGLADARAWLERTAGADG